MRTKWTEDEVAAWLTSVGLEAAAKGFKAASINGEVANAIVESNDVAALEELGLTALQRRKFLVSWKSHDQTAELQGGGEEHDEGAEGTEAKVGYATVIGGGAFGTAMALVLARKGSRVKVWVRKADQAEAVNKVRMNEAYLGGTELPENLTFTSNIHEAVEHTELVLFAIPTQFLRTFLENHRSTFPVGVPLVLCAKGIEKRTLKTPYEILQEELPGKYLKFMAVLSGPSFAKEIAKYQPTNVSVAAEDAEVAIKVQCMMSCRVSNFRVYTVDDVMGCEIAGAVKNVLAIASGACTGCGFGNNTRAALICRGLAEMGRLAEVMGSTGKALPGLAGVGDLMLTCSSEMSRNFTVGFRLAKGETIDEIQGSTNTVAEGVASAQSVCDLANKLHVDMPICQRVFEVLYQNKAVKQALLELQSRPLAQE